MNGEWSGRSLGVTVETLATETGLWCDTCALPSVASVSLAIGVGRRYTLATVARCTDCGETR